MGTLTFIDEENGVFAGLGHSISDQGTAGSPGELKGKFVGSHAVGSIEINGENGVYGSTRTSFAGQVMEVAFAQEVVEGPAQILTTTRGQSARLYDVEIEKVTDADPAS